MSASHANPTLVRLPAKTWLPKITAFAALKVEKRETAAAAKAVDDAHRAARGEILRELGFAKAATCGNYVLSVTETSASAPSITLADGRRVKWADVTSLTIGNQTVKASDVASIYGGRNSSIDVDVAGGA